VQHDRDLGAGRAALRVEEPARPAVYDPGRVKRAHGLASVARYVGRVAEVRSLARLWQSAARKPREARRRHGQILPRDPGVRGEAPARAKVKIRFFIFLFLSKGHSLTAYSLLCKNTAFSLKFQANGEISASFYETLRFLRL
jgi:hypothetical protein